MIVFVLRCLLICSVALTFCMASEFKDIESSQKPVSFCYLTQLPGPLVANIEDFLPLEDVACLYVCNKSLHNITYKYAPNIIASLSILRTIVEVDTKLSQSARKDFNMVFKTIEPILAKLLDKDNYYLRTVVLPGIDPPELRIINILMPFNPVMELNAQVQKARRNILKKAADLGSKEAKGALKRSGVDFSVKDGNYFDAFIGEISKILPRYRQSTSNWQLEKLLSEKFPYEPVKLILIYIQENSSGPQSHEF